jgi:hypothetical protein
MDARMSSLTRISAISILSAPHNFPQRALDPLVNPVRQREANEDIQPLEELEDVPMRTWPG